MKKILFLIFSICIVAGLYFYLERPQPKFFANSIFDQANKITIIQGENTIKLSKKDAWMMTQPVIARPSPDFITALKQTLDELNPEQTIEEGDPKQGIYGLIPPSLVFIIEGEFGKEILSFGKYADFAVARYLQRENDKRIYLIKDDLFKILSLDVKSIRTKYPISFNLNELQSVAAIPANAPAIVIKKSSNIWNLESTNVAFEVDAKTFDIAMQKLSKLEALDFADLPDLQFYGLTNPILTLRILLNTNSQNSTRKSEVIDLIFGKGLGENPSYYMKEVNNPSVFQIHRRAIADWLKNLDYFRSKKLFSKVSSVNGKLLAEQERSNLSQIEALGVMEASAFVAAPAKMIIAFDLFNLEIGEKVPSAGVDNEEPPSFVKIMSEKNEYVYILGAKDIEYLISLSSNVN